LGTERLNVNRSGIATPAWALSPRKLVTRTVFDGRSIVVKALVAVVVLPSAPVAVTVAVYRRP
jgi:hypothetical protein